MYFPGTRTQKCLLDADRSQGPPTYQHRAGVCCVSWSCPDSSISSGACFRNTRTLLISRPPMRSMLPLLLASGASAEDQIVF